MNPVVNIFVDNWDFIVEFLDIKKLQSSSSSKVFFKPSKIVATLSSDFFTYSIRESTTYLLSFTYSGEMALLRIFSQSWAVAIGSLLKRTSILSKTYFESFITVFTPLSMVFSFFSSNFIYLIFFSLSSMITAVYTNYPH